MPNLAKTFKDEVTRLARKEAKAAVKAACPEHRQRAARATLADLKHRVAALEKELRRLSTLLQTLSPQRPSASAGKPLPTFSLQPNSLQPSPRLTGKGMRSLRRKLGLNPGQLGQLLNVSRFAVYEWEKRNGPLRLRQTTRTAIHAIRPLGAREAKARLQTITRK
jgi:hypothetical protein